jgi:YD repeat-containing protein
MLLSILIDRVGTMTGSLRGAAVFVIVAVLGLGAARPVAASPPSAPSGLSAVSVSSTQINLTWTPSADTSTITAYLIQRCQGSGCSSFTQVASVSSGTAYTDSGLAAGTLYQYQVSAADSADTSSGYSSTVSATTLPASASGSVTYAYDALGRLVQASVPGIGTAENYTYDKSGNLTSIVSSPTNVLAVDNLSDPQGSVGSEITIDGSGFSTTPSGNTVEFNGVVATVVSATPTQLVVTIPPGATSGPITVTTGSQTITSQTAFTVTANAGAPTIVSFLPAQIAAGGTVTITGTGFQSTLSANQVQVNQTWAPVVAATSTALTVVVPAGTGSGPVTVSTPNGTAVSTMDLVIAPPGNTPNGVTLNGVMVINGAAATINPSNAGNIRLQLFNGTEGDLLTLAVNSLNTSCTVTIFGPDDSTLLRRTSLTAVGQGVQLPKLGKTGTYTIAVDTSGSVSFNLLGPVTASLTLGGPATPVSIPTSGQWSVLSFSGSKNSYVTLSLSGVTLSAGTLSIYNPDGTALESVSFGTGGVSLQPQLPQSGTYTAVIQPTGAVAGNMNVALTSAPGPNLTVNQSPYNVTLTNSIPVTIPFDGIAGQYLALAAAPSGTISNVWMSVVGPDGTSLGSANWYPCTTCKGMLLNLGPLSQSGTYTLTIQNFTSPATGTAAISLSTPVQAGDLAAGVSFNPPPGLLGQGVIATFTDTYGDYPGVLVGLLTGSSSQATTVFAPDGTVLASFPAPDTSPHYIGPLPKSGPYTVLVQQTQVGTTTPPAVEFVTPVYATWTPVVIGPLIPLLAGQALIGTFSGSSGQYAEVNLSEPMGVVGGLNEPVGEIAGGGFIVIGPDGTAVASAPFSAQQYCAENGEGNEGCGRYGWAGIGRALFGPLPATGSYSVIFEGSNYGYLSPTLTLGPPQSITVGATETLATAGTTFSGTAGTVVSIDITSAPQNATVYVLGPSGAVVAGPVATSTILSVGPLPVTGTYTIVTKNATPSASLTLSSVVVSALTVGTPSSATLSIAGQGAQFTFSGTAGQFDSITLSATSGGIQTAAVSVLAPDGSTLATSTLYGSCAPTCTGSVSFNLGPLPSTGTYTLLALPKTEIGAPASLTAQVNNNPAGGTTTQDLTTTTAGQAVQFAFNAAANQSFNLAFTGVTFAPTSVTSYGVRVTGPSGTVIFSNSCGSSSCLLTLSNLTQTGSYTVIVTPGGSATMAGTATVTTNVLGGILGNDMPLGLTLATGQGASVSVVATAGQPLAIAFGGITTTPAGSGYQVEILDPAGALLSNTNTNATFNLQNPVSGTYTLLIIPYAAVSGSLQVTLSTAVPGMLSTDGSAANFGTTLPGQLGSFAFVGKAGQILSLALTNMTSTVPGDYMVVEFYQADGTEAGGANCYFSGSTCEIDPPALPRDGSYTVQYTPRGIVSFTATLSQDVIGTLTPGVPLTVNLPVVGQSAVLTFPITAPMGETIALNLTAVTTTPAGGSYAVQLYSLIFDSVGPVYNGGVGAGSTNTINLVNQGVSTYTLVITPYAPVAGSLQITLEPGVTPGLTADGGSTVVNTPAPGQHAYLTFLGLAGQNVSLGITNTVLMPSSAVDYVTPVVSPPNSNSVIASTRCYLSSPLCELTLTNLPQSGPYTVEVSPGSFATMSFAATLTTDVGAKLTQGVAHSVSLGSTGQSALLNFSAAAGQSVALSVSNIVSTPANAYYTITVYDPTNANIRSISTQAGATLNLSNLAAGNYSVLITPQNPANATMQVSYQ